MEVSADFPGWGRTINRLDAKHQKLEWNGIFDWHLVSTKFRCFHKPQSLKAKIPTEI